MATMPAETTSTISNNLISSSLVRLAEDMFKDVQKMDTWWYKNIQEWHGSTLNQTQSGIRNSKASESESASGHLIRRVKCCDQHHWAGFLESYFELKEVEATPNRWNLLKAGRSFCRLRVPPCCWARWPGLSGKFRWISNGSQLSSTLSVSRPCWTQTALRKRVKETRAGLAAGQPRFSDIFLGSTSNSWSIPLDSFSLN